MVGFELRRGIQAQRCLCACSSEKAEHATKLGECHVAAAGARELMSCAQTAEHEAAATRERRELAVDLGGDVQVTERHGSRGWACRFEKKVLLTRASSMWIQPARTVLVTW